MGGGKGSWPIAGTAVYMTSYPRTEEGRPWEEILPVRKWLYQTPEQILIKAPMVPVISETNSVNR